MHIHVHAHTHTHRYTLALEVAGNKQKSPDDGSDLGFIAYWWVVLEKFKFLVPCLLVNNNILWF